MRYDKETARICVSAEELTLIARRSVSSISEGSLEEAELSPVCASALSLAIGERSPSTLRYGRETEDGVFEIYGTADDLKEGALTSAFSVRHSAKKPSKEEIELARGKAFILGYMYAIIQGFEQINITIVYINEINGEYNSVNESVSLGKLEQFFDRCMLVVARYAAPEIERVTKRLPTLEGMRFPFKTVRDGQSELVRATYRTLRRGEKLYACAPTGTGKTVSVLYPALKLIGEGRCDKLFYLTPKTTTAGVAASCIELLASEGADVRAIVLSSKERSCSMGMLCKRRSSLCPISSCKGIEDAVLALYERAIPVVRIDDVREVADRFKVCPYELALTYSELCDAVICDINYLFDPRVYLRRYFDRGGRFAFLIDEAHNLGERTREMYSAELCPDEVIERCGSPLIHEGSILPARTGELMTELSGLLYPYLKDELRPDKEGVMHGAANLGAPPDGLYSILEELCTLCDAELRRSYLQRDELAADRTFYLRELYYGLKRCYDALLRFEEGYRLLLFCDGDRVRMKLMLMDTGGIIRSVLDRGMGAVFFSATLSPIDYYKSILGGERTSETLIAHSPFAPECLSVSIMDKISTRYSERERTLPAVSRAIAAAISPKRGNYMIFAPSFEYLEALARDFKERYPKIATLEQRRDMTPGEKQEFLDKFLEDSDRYLVGFCTLGGIYSEGVDLVGRSLIGAIVVGIGMPSLSYEREAMAEFYQDKYDSGKEYAYVYPGMNRVLQAAGRVIRTESDKGIIVLIDDRFDDPIYKKSIPALWEGMAYVGDPKELNERIKEFWRGVDEEEKRKNQG
ncbi:MAG: ATP-dependent DNA helicase [Clostridia bacterium]|nr:ATP-dependent DNA helicase [Clostridia bacterium]